jgi:ubiquinone/menaquinone biosynthesis C-methylase UbiE
MGAMSSTEAVFCRSAPWRGFARRVVVPWVLGDGETLGRDVLELGGGSGAMAQELLSENREIRLTLTDIDPRMAAAARRRLARFGPRARVIVGDGTRLEFADGAFDTICSWLMLHHTIDWEGVLAEAVRVIRPGGLLVGYDLTDTRTARLVHRLDGSDHRLLRAPELERELVRLGTTAPAVRTAAGGLVMRFRAGVA